MGPPTLLSAKAISSKSSSLKERAKSLAADRKKLRRGKRQVIFEEPVDTGSNDEDEFVEEALLRQQLQQLSDGELAALADIVRDEMARSEPQLVAVPQYEIIEIPDEMLDEAEAFPRDRRAVAPIDWAMPEESDEPEYIVVPEEAVIEALNDEQDELELRERIAEIAQILNARATRRALLL
ncbi:unnamed protein product [Nippostrongylus brasiliensis]|uniref:RNA polymerase II-associated protein 1 n=1 Tax=Nippostrongylus brasiliensis TaxID=27835 RepID=A0A0N4XZL8_NIPBR|nr:unnamed protein product [Nippostrongylus brasiliensis]